MSQLWKDLIHIPERVHSSDFVMKLTDGVQKAQQTVGAYVVTRDIARAFDQALGLIGGAIGDGSSKAAYLHGSFGSGKSHFMAVLDLLLDPEHSVMVRRELPALATVTGAHDAWLGKKKLLMVPYHFLGAVSAEEKILGGYVHHVRARHPEAPIPGVYLSAKLLENAALMRETMGEEAFFAMLNGGGDPWSDAAWDADTYQAAADAPPTDDAHAGLVSALVTYVFPAMMDMAQVDVEGGGFVGLDEGLAIISRHARDLGYEGLVLFHDELILWLSRQTSNLDFITREEQKLAKLVEAQHADRPIPIISFVARQRSLSEFLGDGHTGSEKAGVELSLNWLEGRFDTINLQDHDLPLIVHERLLKPRDAQAAEAIERSFEAFRKRTSPQHADLMRTSEMGDDRFRQVYPFSPSLVQALIALSTFLQRERTSLRLMLLLLVEQRETLRLGHVVPVGDLWDVVIQGKAPFSEGMRRTYQGALDLWEHKLRPLLKGQHGFDLIEDPDVSPAKRQAWENDARLLKTLLVAALVPNVESLRNMTISRLTALNLSAVNTPLPNMQDQVVRQKLTRWATSLSELHISEDTADPIVTLRLNSLDASVLLDRVKAQDTAGARRRKIQQLLFEWMNLDEAGMGGFSTHRLPWRGARRELRVYYRNVRELPLDALIAEGDAWCLFVDYPFDEGQFSPSDDHARIEEFRRAYPHGSDTIVWLPRFLTEKGQTMLGRLVCVDYVLDRFEEESRDLPPEARSTIRQSLEGMRTMLRRELRDSLEVAYGLRREADRDTVDHTQAEIAPLQSLRPGHTVRLDGGLSFQSAIEPLMHDALSHQLPEAPALPDEVLTTGQARKIWEVILRALAEPDGRTFTDGAERALTRKYVGPLELGAQGDTHFALETTWRDRIERSLGERRTQDLRVHDLRDQLDPHGKRGLPPLAEDLIIATVAAQEHRTLRRMGSAQELAPGNLQDSDSLVVRELPDPATWDTARAIARQLFGLHIELPIRDAANVDRLADALREQLKQLRKPAQQLVERLHRAADDLRLVAEDCPRITYAIQLDHLLRTLTGESTPLLNKLVASAGDEAQRAQAEAQLRHLESMNKTLSSVRWELFLTAASHPDDPEIQAALTGARQVFRDPETVQHLIELSKHEEAIFQRLIKRPAPPQPTPQPPAPPAPPEPPVQPEPPARKPVTSISLAQGDDLDALPDKLRQLLQVNPKARLRLDIFYIVEEGQ